MFRSLIEKVKTFRALHPRATKTLGILLVLVFIPLTVLAALTVQDLRQRAGGTGLQIVDANGNYLPTTSDTQVYLRINLPENWVSLGMKTNKHNFIEQAYAQTNQCSPPYQGFLGCFSSSNQPSGSVCTSSCTTDDGQSGEWCYTSTTVGSSCTNSTGQNGVCNEQGTCVASAVPTPTPTPTTKTPTPTSPPIIVGNCGNKNCSPNQACIGTSFDSSTFCLTKGAGRLGSYCGTPNKTPNSEACSSGYCDLTLRCANQSQATSTPIPTIPQSNATPTTTSTDSTAKPTSVPPTPTPIPNILQGIYIENKDSDGSSNGSEPLRITSGFDSYINSQVPWRLNDLLPSQNQATRLIQITLLGSQGTVVLTGTVTLIKSTVPTEILSRVEVSMKCEGGMSNQVAIKKSCYLSALAYDTANFAISTNVNYEWGISSTNSIGTLNATQNNITTFYAQNTGSGDIWVIARQGDNQVRKSVGVQVGSSVTSGNTNSSSSASLQQPSTSGTVNLKEDILDQFGAKGPNLKGDVDNNGVIDQYDYNSVLREDQ